MKKNKEIVLDPQPTEEEIESGQSITNEIETKIRDQIGAYNLSKVKRIAYYLVQIGLPIAEACALVDLTLEEFAEILRECPIIETVLKKKELEYKKDLLFVLTSRARGGDDKLAQWLLERRYPGEFSSKRKPDGDNDDILAEGLAFVQRNGDSSPLVTETSGKAFIIHKKGSGDIIKKLSEFLK